ncbi:hypothetical protein CesoFtcFv8_026756 [Champsocephalus esox]|uniref:Uncharacterized protein n=1 Tax=Champsocephalus esox TaxID=159716 RepID=A0AAN8AZR0_9TELE|nr:hypothetical protein CesoFtcFv8_026756 [Champsocephalus esox]
MVCCALPGFAVSQSHTKQMQGQAFVPSGDTRRDLITISEYESAGDPISPGRHRTTGCHQPDVGLYWQIITAVIGVYKKHEVLQMFMDI